MVRKKDILREIELIDKRLDEKIEHEDLNYFFKVKNPEYDPRIGGCYHREYFTYSIPMKRVIAMIVDYLDLELTRIEAIPQKHELVKRKK